MVRTTAPTKPSYLMTQRVTSMERRIASPLGLLDSLPQTTETQIDSAGPTKPTTGQCQRNEPRYENEATTSSLHTFVLLKHWLGCGPNQQCSHTSRAIDVHSAYPSTTITGTANFLSDLSKVGESGDENETWPIVAGTCMALNGCK